MSRALDDLDPRLKPLAFELIARCAEAGFPIMIIYTRRTQAEQDALIAKGQSWVKHSKHQDGLAIDLCPYNIFALDGPDKLEWDTEAPVWQIIGPIGEKLGLRWGGRWVKKDMGHFEYVS